MVQFPLAAQLLFAAFSVAAITPERIPGAYMIEFDDSQDLSSLESLVETNGYVRRRFDSPVFKGLSVQLNDVENAEESVKILSMATAAKKIWPISLHSMPNVTIHWTGNGTDSFEAQTLTNQTSKPYTPHAMTQVDKIRAKGYTGKGIKVAVIDTGVDYKHPALGGCFGDGCLVSGGHDFVGDNYSGRNDPVPDDDPMDCDGHGTHVSGIIAAQNNTMGFTGAAPGVNLASYRVFGCYGSVTDDILVAAFTRAYEDGADVISLSLGSPIGWSEHPWSAVISRIAEAGVASVVAAGNDGAAGAFYHSSPADGKNVAAISAIENIVTPVFMRLSNYTVDGKTNDLLYSVTYRTPLEGSLPLWAPALHSNATTDACETLPEDIPDLSQYMILVRAGGCAYGQQSTNLLAKGATSIALYYNDAGIPVVPTDLVWGVNTNIVVQSTTGKAWVDALKAGKKVVVNLPNSEKQVNTLVEIESSQGGGAVTTFSSWGPTWEMDTKPTFGAPGGKILSTYPLRRGAYAVFSGTSMSTPLTSAIYALLNEVRGKMKPEVVKNLLSSTAKPQLFHDGTHFHTFLAPVAQQGAGLIQAYDAAFTTTLLEPSNLSFNDTDFMPKSLNLTLRNEGQSEISYDLSYVSSRTVLTLDESGKAAAFPNEMVESAASLRFSPSQVTIKPGESATVDVSATLPEIDGSRLPLWSGWVTINGTDGTSLSMPYQGLAASLRNSTVLDAQAGTWISRFNVASYGPVPNYTNFNLPPKGTEDLSSDGANVPLLITNYILGTRLVHAELVPFSNGTQLNDSIGEHSGFPTVWMSRGRHIIDWGGKLDNGEYAAPGSYRFKVKALKLRGDEGTEGDWDIGWTQPFSITYQS
ncbi:unnamed protein product [Clonostachys chloroleuca]|uniref:Minor extracellular protease vpr n=1 Tax=Clonostachys chloroleuca TaxID=1926264 RepID=A0AA35M2U1_9HYPO|nr:unnamed protein product [Clonostachys chloroleuca]